VRKPAHIARLYAAPPSEFTATRNRLAAELRKDGRADEARALAQLRKPSAALWGVNRLATTQAKAVEALLDSVAQLRRSQLRDPRAAADGLRAQRAALETLVARGRDILADAGLAASQQALRRLSDTLMGAAVDRAQAEALRRGELTAELPAPGFEAFSGARLPASPRLRLVRASVSPARRSDRPEAAARTAQAEQRRRREAEKLAGQARDDTRAVTELEAERSRARARAAELEQRLRAARRAARRSAAAAERARRNSDST
jgi:hypothetical protein